jgi:hypothetical protein
MARLVREKGADLIPELIEHVNAEDPDIRFKVRGTGDPELLRYFSRLRGEVLEGGPTVPPSPAGSVPGVLGEARSVHEVGGNQAQLGGVVLEGSADELRPQIGEHPSEGGAVLSRCLLEVVEEPGRDGGGLVPDNQVDDRDPRGDVYRGELPDSASLKTFDRYA